MIAALIVAFMLVMLMLPFITWSTNANKEVTRQSSISQAQWYADAGIEMAYKRLKAPDLDLWLPADGNEYTLPPMPMSHGSAEVTLQRSALDSSLVEMNATGYYYLAGGPFKDSTLQAAVRGRIRAVARVLNVAEFMVAKPRTLKIDYGTNVASGKVYAEELTFSPRGTNPLNTPTQVQEALYFQTCTLPATPADVVMGIPPRQLPNPLDLGVADSVMRNLYFQKTQGPGTVPQQTLDVSQPFSGLQAAPPGGAPNVYYADGDLHLGTASQPLIVSGVYTIYITGTAYIHNSILLNDSSSWIAIVTENDLVILDAAAPDFVPANLELNGNYYANGGWLVRGVARPAGSTLRVNGGFVVHGRIEFSDTWSSNRIYTFARSPDTNLVLPNTTTQLDYQILRAN